MSKTFQLGSYVHFVLYDKSSNNDILADTQGNPITIISKSALFGGHLGFSHKRCIFFYNT